MLHLAMLPAQQV